MSEQQNVTVVRDAYGAFALGDIQGILDALTDDVVWELPGPPEIPYAGSFNGKEGVADFFRILTQTEDVQAFEPHRFFADGDMVVVLGHYVAHVQETRAVAHADWVHVFTFRNGKIAKWRDYLDTAKYARAYTKAPVLSV